MFEVRFARQRGPPSALLQLTVRVCVTCARGASRRGEGGRLGVRRRLPAPRAALSRLHSRPDPALSPAAGAYLPRERLDHAMYSLGAPVEPRSSRSRRRVPLTVDSPPPQASRGRRPSRSTKTCRCLRGGKSSTNLGESRIKSREPRALRLSRRRSAPRRGPGPSWRSGSTPSAPNSACLRGRTRSEPLGARAAPRLRL